MRLDIWKHLHYQQWRKGQHDNRVSRLSDPTELGQRIRWVLRQEPPLEILNGHPAARPARQPGWRPATSDMERSNEDLFCPCGYLPPRTSARARQRAAYQPHVRFWGQLLRYGGRISGR